jgi:hypothetical protein
MSKRARLQILERSQALIEDEWHWCSGDLARDAQGFPVGPTDSNAKQRCALGALAAAAYHVTGDLRRARDMAITAMRPLIGSTSLTHINDIKGHAAVLALFDLAIATK